jgi:hypothetical protein
LRLAWDRHVLLNGPRRAAYLQANGAMSQHDLKRTHAMTGNAEVLARQKVKLKKNWVNKVEVKCILT